MKEIKQTKMSEVPSMEWIGDHNHDNSNIRSSSGGGDNSDNFNDDNNDNLNDNANDSERAEAAAAAARTRAGKAKTNSENRKITQFRTQCHKTLNFGGYTQSISGESSGMVNRLLMFSLMRSGGKPLVLAMFLDSAPGSKMDLPSGKPTVL